MLALQVFRDWAKVQIAWWQGFINRLRLVWGCFLTSISFCLRRKQSKSSRNHDWNFAMLIILSHALFLKVFKSWVYPSKKKVWCASKIFLKIENMGPKECKNVKILEKNPWHQLSSWGSLSWSQSIKINCNFGVLLIKLTNFRCLLCLNGGSNRPEH